MGTLPANRNIVFLPESLKKRAYFVHLLAFPGAGLPAPSHSLLARYASVAVALSTHPGLSLSGNAILKSILLNLLFAVFEEPLHSLCVLADPVRRIVAVEGA